MSGSTADQLTNLVTNVLVAVEAVVKFQAIASIANTEVTAVATAVKASGSRFIGNSTVSGNSTNGNTAASSAWVYQGPYSNAMAYIQ